MLFCMWDSHDHAGYVGQPLSDLTCSSSSSARILSGGRLRRHRRDLERAFSDAHPGIGRRLLLHFGRALGAVFPAAIGLLAGISSLAMTIAIFTMGSYGFVVLAALLLPETRGRILEMKFWKGEEASSAAYNRMAMSIFHLPATRYGPRPGIKFIAEMDLRSPPVALFSIFGQAGLDITVNVVPSFTYGQKASESFRFREIFADRTLALMLALSLEPACRFFSFSRHRPPD